MNIRDEMLDVIRGEIPRGLLFVPRLDVWYHHNRARGTLPVGYEQLSLPEVAGKLGVGTHSVIPDFIRSAPQEDVVHRGLGFYNNPAFPYRVDFHNVDFQVEKTPDELRVTYRGSLGAVTTRFRYGPALFASGVSIPDILEYPIKRVDDYRVLAQILSGVEILPTPDGYRAYHDQIGDDGLAVAFLSAAAGPMQHILRDLRTYEGFWYDQWDYPDQVQVLSESLGRIYEQMTECVLESCAEVVLFGANYDDALTPPPFFARYILPWLNQVGDRLHSAGKHLLTHTDGENKRLLPMLGQCRFDVADSICPAPMTALTLMEYRREFGSKCTIWGGVPSVLLLKHSCGDDEFRAFVQSLIHECKPYDHLILSIADTTPPDADFARIQYVREACSATRGKSV